jgi:hypothetical protein
MVARRPFASYVARDEAVTPTLCHYESGTRDRMDAARMDKVVRLVRRIAY